MRLLGVDEPGLIGGERTHRAHPDACGKGWLLPAPTRVPGERRPAGIQLRSARTQLGEPRTRPVRGLMLPGPSTTGGIDRICTRWTEPLRGSPGQGSPSCSTCTRTTCCRLPSIPLPIDVRGPGFRRGCTRTRRLGATAPNVTSSPTAESRACQSLRRPDTWRHGRPSRTGSHRDGNWWRQTCSTSPAQVTAQASTSPPSTETPGGSAPSRGIRTCCSSARPAPGPSPGPRSDHRWPCRAGCTRSISTCARGCRPDRSRARLCVAPPIGECRSGSASSGCSSAVPGPACPRGRAASFAPPSPFWAAIGRGGRFTSTPAVASR